MSSPACGLGDDRLGQVDGQGEADAVAHAGLGRGDADEVAVTVEEGAAGVAGVDGGVGLDEVVQALAAEAGAEDVDAAVEAADDADGGAAREVAQRVADRDGQLADSQAGRVAERDGRQVLGIDLHEGEVGQRVDAGDGAVEDGAVIEDDRDVLGVADDVAVRDDQAVARDDDAGAAAARDSWNPGRRSWDALGQLEAFRQQILEVAQVIGRLLRPQATA